MFDDWKITFFYVFVIVSIIILDVLLHFISVTYMLFAVYVIAILVGLVITIIIDIHQSVKKIIHNIDNKIEQIYEELFYIENNISGKLRTQSLELKNLIQSIILISDVIIKSEKNDIDIIKKMEDIKEIAFRLNTTINSLMN